MSWFMVDVETDGPCPGLFSMVSFGAIKVIEPLVEAPTFYGQCRPLEGADYQEEALAVAGHSRDETLTFWPPADVMKGFSEWIAEHNDKGRPMFLSDNNGFDWQFINYYFWLTLGHNPFGHSSTNLGSLYKGQVGDMFKSFKHLRQTKHTHHPVDDARGNAEALVHMKNELGLRISFK